MICGSGALSRGGRTMNIGFIADSNRKDLIENFCVAYKSILSKHNLFATEMTGRRIEQATNLHVHKFLSGSVGGENQFIDRIQRNDLDLVIYFYNPIETSPNQLDILSVTQECDRYNIPVATNIATAEAMILAMDRGDFDWRINVRHDD